MFAERYLSFKSTFERALSARAYFGFFKIATHCPTPCSCTPASNAAFSASVHLRLPCLCACGLKTTDFANGDNGGVSPGLCVLVFVGVVDARHLSFKSTFERVASTRPNSGSFKILAHDPTKSSRAHRHRQSPSPARFAASRLAVSLASLASPYPSHTSPPRARARPSPRPSKTNSFSASSSYYSARLTKRARVVVSHSFANSREFSSSPTRGSIGDARVASAHRRSSRRHRLHVHQRILSLVHPRLDVFLRHRAVVRPSSRRRVARSGDPPTARSPSRFRSISRAIAKHRPSIDRHRRSTTRRSTPRSTHRPTRRSTDRPMSIEIPSIPSREGNRIEPTARIARAASAPRVDDDADGLAARAESRRDDAARASGRDGRPRATTTGRAMMMTTTGIGRVGVGRSAFWARDALERRARGARGRALGRAGGVTVRAMRSRGGRGGDRCD